MIRNMTIAAVIAALSLAPVTAQEMMTLLAFATFLLP